jgi:hypothetical protein
MLNVAVPEPRLQRPSIVPFYWQARSRSRGAACGDGSPRACGPVSLRRAIRAWKLLDVIGAPRSAAARRPEEDGLRMCPAWSGLHEAGRPQARPGAIADRTPRMPAGHFSTRSGSWWRRDRRTGCLSAPPSGPQPRSLSDTRASLQTVRGAARGFRVNPRCPALPKTNPAGHRDRARNRTARVDCQACQLSTENPWDLMCRPKDAPSGSAAWRALSSDQP